MASRWCERMKIISHALWNNVVFKSPVIRPTPVRYFSASRFLAVGKSVWNRKWVALGVGVGVYLTYDQRFISYAATGINQHPQLKPSRVVHVESDYKVGDLTLFQYQTCPFCCKVRAFLDYYGFSYKIVEVDPVLRQQIKFSQWRKVPILIVEDKSGVQQLNDSSYIISALRTIFVDPSVSVHQITSYYPVLTSKNEAGKDVIEIMNKYNVMYRDSEKGTNQAEIEREKHWRKWADNELVHMLSPNVYRTPAEALQAFQWFSEVGEWKKNFPAWERFLIIYVGAAAMYFIGKRLKKRHSLKPEVRESLYDSCQKWIAVVNTHGKYLGGTSPNLADLAVFGVLSSIEGCETFKDVLLNTNIEPWYMRMKEAVMNHSGLTSTS